MKRRLFQLLAGLSLLLCVATVVVWARSLRRGDGIYYEASNSWFLVISSKSIVSLHHHDIGNYMHGTGKLGWQFKVGPAFNTSVTYGNPGTVLEPHFLGLSLKVVRGGSIVTSPKGVTPRTGTFWNSYWDVRIPDWFLVVVFSLASLLFVRIAMQNQMPGLCPKCGYDIRATPGRCPECGTVLLNVGGAPST